MFTYLPQSHLSCLPCGIRLCGGRPIRGRGRFPLPASVSVEGKILFDVSNVSIGNKACLTQPALALAVLALQQVACSLFTTKDLPRTCHLEAFGNGFPCLCFSRDSWHGARKLTTHPPLASKKRHLFLEIRGCPTSFASHNCTLASFALRIWMPSAHGVLLFFRIPQSSPTPGGRRPRRPRAHSRRRRHGQDPHRHLPHRPHARAENPRLRDPGRHLHQQGRQRNARTHRRHGFKKSSVGNDRLHLPLALRPDPPRWHRQARLQKEFLDLLVLGPGRHDETIAGSQRRQR